MAKIYLVRHCESEGNASRRTQAHLESLVTHKGYQQVEMLRRRFKGVHLDAVYSSDSYRSVLTALPVAKERNLPVHTRILLREVTTGVWEDMAWGNIARDFPEAHETWKKTPWDLKVPGASSFQQVSDNLIFGLRRIAKEIGNNGVAMVVSHSCTIKAALCTILGKPMTEVKDLPHGENTSVSLLDIDPEGNIAVEFMNDASHLPEHLCRPWGNSAGSAINMELDPCRLPEQKDDLLRLAAADAEERGETFDGEAYYKAAEELLKKDPNAIGMSTLQGKICGFVRMGFDENLPRDCTLVERMYVEPELQGKGYSEQLFGYAAYVSRYSGVAKRIAIPKHCTAEEQSVVDRFVFDRMRGFVDEYVCMELFCPHFTDYTLA